MSAINAINLSRFFLYFIPQDPWTQINADPDPQFCNKATFYVLAISMSYHLQSYRKMTIVLEIIYTPFFSSNAYVHLIEKEKIDLYNFPIPVTCCNKPASVA